MSGGPHSYGFDPAQGDYGVEISALIRDERYIDITTTIAKRTHKLVIDTEERFIREGLIRLGWTPPPAEDSSDASV